MDIVASIGEPVRAMADGVRRLLKARELGLPEGDVSTLEQP